MRRLQPFRAAAPLACGLLTILCAGAAAAPAWTAWPTQEEEAPPAEGPAPAGDEEEDDEPDTFLLLRGGDVFTGTGAVLRGADLLIKNSRIDEIGYGLFVPEGAEVLDVRGLRLYPGMVALSASSRVTEGTFASSEGFVEPGYDPTLDQQDDEEWDFDALLGGEEALVPGAAEDAATRTLDAYDPFSSFLVLTLAAGITTVEQSNAAVKLKRSTIDDVVMRDGYLTSLSFASPDARRNLRKDFAAARQYLFDLRAYEDGGKKGEEPSKRGINAAVLSVLEGKTRAKFNEDDREQLLGIALLAQEYGFRPVIDGCREGWTVADQLGRAGATAILVPRDRRWKDELQLAEGGSSIENAAILHRAGVQVAVKALSGAIDLGGIAGRDLLHLQIEAGFAVRGGLPDEAALAAVTLVPARVLGVDHRVGSLEVGKDADILVTDGDLLHYETFVQYAVVAGKVAYDKQEEIYYAHIRPRPVPEPAAEEPGIEEPAPDEGADGGVQEDAPDEEPVETPEETPDEDPEETPEDGSGG